MVLSRQIEFAAPREALEQEQSEEFRRLFHAYEHKDHQLNVLGIPKAKMVSYLCTTLSREQGLLLTERKGEELQGLLYAVPREWQSEQLGCRIWGVQHLLLAPEAPPSVAERLVQRALRQLRSSADFIYVRPASSDIAAVQALEANGFRLVGGEVVGGVRSKQVVVTTPAQVTLGPMRAEEREDVATIIEAGHCHNHYMYDPRFERSRVMQLYVQETERLMNCSGGGVIVAREEEQGKVVGFISFKMNRQMSQLTRCGMASLDFIGVHPGAQCRGLGNALNGAALAYLEEEGYDRVTVRTMISNYQALSALRKIGFRITSSNYVMHCWLAP